MRPPNYLPLVIAEVERLAKIGLPRVCHISIRHDDGCDLLNGRGKCNCDPKLGEVWADTDPAS